VPNELPKSYADWEEVVIGLNCRKCKATKTIERSTTYVSMEQVVVSRTYKEVKTGQIDSNEERQES
jgi:hypothetical protein